MIIPTNFSKRANEYSDFEFDFVNLRYEKREEDSKWQILSTFETLLGFVKA